MSADSQATSADPNPHSWLQNLGIAIEVVCPSLALIVTLLRIYIRVNTKTFGWVLKEMYIGIHYWDIPLETFNPTTGLIWIYIVGAVYNPILALVKQSVLIFLLRFSGVKALVRQVVWATIIFNGALMVAVFFVVLFQCIPIEINWNPLVQGHCIKQFSFGVSTACLTILTDLIAVVLPFYIFLGLKMNKRRKIGLIAVFMLGALVTVVSIIRLYFLAQNFTDPSADKNFSVGFCVSSIECNLAILTASAPALWPLIRRWLPGAASTHDRSYGPHKYGSSATHRQQGWIRAEDGPAPRTTDSSYALKEMGGSKSRTEVRSAARDSDEEILTGTGIMRTTQFTVSNDDAESQRPGTRPGPYGNAK
ncbi:hypothetical protein SLS62_004332 [Diatrype stigma]|uniref:Rhodopsin domain-containing protein n=1 Tax=Diatrype stigma TaxID=117547 RepID=A0AAN9YTH6_9PEZI